MQSLVSGIVPLFKIPFINKVGSVFLMASQFHAITSLGNSPKKRAGQVTAAFGLRNLPLPKAL